MAPDQVAITFRFPPAIYERLRTAAFEDRTPMNAIVTIAVEIALDERDKAQAQSPEAPPISRTTFVLTDPDPATPKEQDR